MKIAGWYNTCLNQNRVRREVPLWGIRMNCQLILPGYQLTIIFLGWTLPQLNLFQIFSPHVMPISTNQRKHLQTAKWGQTRFIVASLLGTTWTIPGMSPRTCRSVRRFPAKGPGRLSDRPMQIYSKSCEKNCTIFSSLIAAYFAIALHLNILIKNEIAILNGVQCGWK